MAEVKGTKGLTEQAEEGMKLFEKEAEIEGDLAAATAFKDAQEAKMSALETEAAALTGKENKKARVEKEKERAALKNDKQYIDALKVVKGNPPVHGFFIKSGTPAPQAKKEAKPAEAAPPPEAEPEVAKKDDKKGKKKDESAGISREERAELEGLKQKIIDRKTELKGSGMSGGQINKDEQVVAWVARMNELKEKESPGSTAAAGKDDKKGKKKKVLDSDSQAALEAKQRQLDEYTDRLRTEFKYSKKEIAADPEYQELKAEIDKMSK